MLEFILAGQNLPFSVALAVMLCIAVLEGVGALFGLAVSTFFETLIPEFDMDVDGPDVNSATTLSHFFSWLRVGKVPFLILIIIFLTGFGLLGLLTQQASLGITGSLLPAWIAVIPAFLLALPCVRIFGGVFATLMPKDETEATSEESFIGRIAVITLGKAKKGSPAEARLQDEYGQDHYIMVEPDDDSIFEAGSQVLVVAKVGTIYSAIMNTNKSLVSD